MFHWVAIFILPPLPPSPSLSRVHSCSEILFAQLLTPECVTTFPIVFTGFFFKLISLCIYKWMDQICIYILKNKQLCVLIWFHCRLVLCVLFLFRVTNGYFVVWGRWCLYRLCSSSSTLRNELCYKWYNTGQCVVYKYMWNILCSSPCICALILNSLALWTPLYQQTGIELYFVLKYPTNAWIIFILF